MRDRTRSVKVCASATATVIAALVVSACGGSSESSTPRTGREIYVASCQTCHGRDGEGFVGPSLIDTAARFPDITAEIAVVTNGEGEMPAWGGRLTTKEIATVVDYTRQKFTTISSTTSTTIPFVGPTQ